MTSEVLPTIVGTSGAPACGVKRCSGHTMDTGPVDGQDLFLTSSVNSWQN